MRGIGVIRAGDKPFHRKAQWTQHRLQSVKNITRCRRYAFTSDQGGGMGQGAIFWHIARMAISLCFVHNF